MADDNQVVVVQVQQSSHRNQSIPTDVNADMFTSSIDALIVINFLNNADASNPVSELGSPPPFLDVNGDLFVTPLDALIVINHLNRLSGGEGETTNSAHRESNSAAVGRWAPPAVHIDQANSYAGYAQLRIPADRHREQSLARDRSPNRFDVDLIDTIFGRDSTLFADRSGSPRTAPGEQGTASGVDVSVRDLEPIMAVVANQSPRVRWPSTE
jgi:hypothetical protein